MKVRSSSFVCPTLPAAAVLLLEGNDCAEQSRRSIWDFAVDMQSLRAAGVSVSALRWQVFSGYADHAVEVPAAKGGRRSFRRQGRMPFTDKTCFVLTEAGVRYARTICSGQTDGQPANGRIPLHANGSATRIIPRWDAESRKLWFGNQLVKAFDRFAPYQEQILATFEAQGWPPRIADPLPRHAGMNPKRRLRQTLRSLNESLQHGLIHFRPDGTGRGIRCEVVPSTTRT